MRELNDKKMVQIIGGINITGAFINSLVRGIDVLLDLGRSIGSAIRRAKDHSLCPL